MNLNPPAFTPEPPEYPSVSDSLDAFVGAINEHLTSTARNVLQEASSVTGSYGSCGITVLSGLQRSPEDIVNKILKERAPSDSKKIREAFVMFSDIASSPGGAKLYNYIKEKNLGNIMQFGPRMNPNSGNMICLWIWEPPHASLSPKHKYMPVYGKLLDMDSYGNYTQYVDDPRFKSQLNGVSGREA